jgi:hypothetical protein
VRCYFDGSTSEDSQWLTLAGFMASDPFWGEFQNRWDAMLRNRYPVAPYIHMSEILARVDPFEREAGWTDGKIESLVWDATGVLTESDKGRFRSFVCRIDIKAHAKLLSEGYVLQDPSVICAECCLAPAMTWYIETFGFEFAYVFYDQGEPFFKNFRHEWSVKHTPRGRVSVWPFWDMFADVSEKDMRDHPPIQSADIVAWAESRSTSSRKSVLKYRELARLIRSTVPQSGLVIDETLMRESTASNPDFG